MTEDGAERTEERAEIEKRKEGGESSAEREKEPTAGSWRRRPGGGRFVAAPSRQKIKKKRKTLIPIKSR